MKKIIFYVCTAIGLISITAFITAKKASKPQPLSDACKVQIIEHCPMIGTSLVIPLTYAQQTLLNVGDSIYVNIEDNSIDAASGDALKAVIVK